MLNLEFKLIQIFDDIDTSAEENVYYDRNRAVNIVLLYIVIC